MKRISEDTLNLIRNQEADIEPSDLPDCRCDEHPERQEDIQDLLKRIEELEKEIASKTYKGNSVAYWHDKATAYGDICLEVNKILNCPGVDIRDKSRELMKENKRFREALEEIGRSDYVHNKIVTMVKQALKEDSDEI